MNKEELLKIKEELKKEFDNITDINLLNDLKVKYMGKKGIITELSTHMKDLDNNDKKEFGILLNELKNLFNNNFETTKSKIELEEINNKLQNEKIDVTLPGYKLKRGSKHPLNRIVEEIEDLFVSMGYDVIEGNEIEDDLHCFELLNLPKGHPARDMQDTFYITDEMLLRTHTSPMQARTMIANESKGPIRIICPGKTYRRDDDDATHSHQFMQVEGLVIGENISLADLKGTLLTFAKKMLGENVNIRFRPSYFPFTEPSYEVDVSCFKCNGKGCPICKNTGWIEILGSGMVHPNVLKMCGYDPEKYKGFAFGVGVERLAMFKYGIPDVRYFYTNDYRFLKNFDGKEDE